MTNQPLTDHTAILCAAVRSTIILNLRRVQQGKPPKAVTDGLIDPESLEYFVMNPEQIDPTVRLLSKLRFPNAITEQQGQAILAEMRDYFGFALSLAVYCKARLTVSRLDPRMSEPLTVLHSAMNHKD